MRTMIELIEPCIPALRRYARTLTRDITEADDLVQDCLERAISRWGQRQGDGQPRAWLFSILHNLAVSRMRQARRRGVDVPLESIAPAAVPSAPATQEDGARHRDLLRAVDGLPDDQRAVLLLVSVEDLSYAEAASVLGVPIGTVMSRLARARERLWRATQSDGGQPARPVLRRVK